MSEERIQKLISKAGLTSRRKAEDLIRRGQVTVNGKIATLGQKADPGRDVIKVDGKKLRPPSSHHRYLLINKPSGCVSTVSDPEARPTVLDLIPARLRKGLVPVGRLDYHSEGLLLLTDDGDFAHRVSHPRYGCRKVYLAKVRGVPSEKQLDRLRAGVNLDGKLTAPCEIRPYRLERGTRTAKKNSWWEVQLVEGRNRQIREMFLLIGHLLQRLRRVAIGSLEDTSLPTGGWRELEKQEIDSLLAGRSRGDTSRRRRAAGRQGKAPAKGARPGTARKEGRPSKGTDRGRESRAARRERGRDRR